MGRTREELAWSAGLFDGEGHISCRDRTGTGHLPVYKSPRTLVITISQHHIAVLERFQAAVGLGKIYSVKRSRATGELYTSYSWRTGKFQDVQAVVAMIWPWLGEVKRAQAVEALATWHRLTPKHTLACRGRLCISRLDCLNRCYDDRETTDKGDD